MLIPDKRTFYDLAFRRLCGNTPMMWASLSDFFNDQLPGGAVPHPMMICLRATDNRHKWCMPQIHAGDAQGWLDAMGIVAGGYIISAIPPPHNDRWGSLQGELSWDAVRGEWMMFCAEHGGYQRDILRMFGTESRGFDVVKMLKKHCDYDSFQDIMDLFDIYTEGTRYPTIEFAVFPSGAKRIGWANRNTLIWEIRHY
jgi:hypothetical protein